jgi:hypothetical protein
MTKGGERKPGIKQTLDSLSEEERLQFDDLCEKLSKWPYGLDGDELINSVFFRIEESRRKYVGPSIFKSDDF